MSVTAKVGSRTYEFQSENDWHTARHLWEFAGWEGGEDQEAFENELTSRGIDWYYDLEAFQEEQ